MSKIYIVGNPNSGKTTLFNSITRSNEHTGNWHGVTVDKKSKIIKYGQCEYELVDLPGIYSLNAYSLEEQVSIDEINSSGDDKILYLIDANNFKRSMLLALNLLIQNKNIKILINNYKTFNQHGGQIDIEYLKKVLGCEVEIVNAKKIKPNKNFFQFKTSKTAFITSISNEINKNKENNKIKNIEILYNYILKIDKNCVKKENNIYGYNKIDKKLLKLIIYIPAFIVLMFAIIYTTFFLLGPTISGLFLKVLGFVIQKPIMSIIRLATKSKFIISLFEEGIFGACFSVLGFLPQIALMYLFLSMLENSGLISRMAFLFDDALENIGLNGKIVYTLLMGLGCSTTATISAKNMADKNSQIKASILTPFISCSAKLPIYSVVAGAILGAGGIGVIFALYLLGIIVAIIMAIILNKFIPNKQSMLLLEFPPLKYPQISNVLMSIKTSCKQFLTKVFGVIFGASILLWLMSNINIKLQYVEDVSKSVLYSFSMIISWIFKPIGLNNPNIICSLLVGLVAKELIVSNFAISNKVSTLSGLSASLVMSSSAVNFNLASGISFLVFTLLYFPCVSNFGVMLKQIGAKFTLFGVGLQFVLAYLLSYLAFSVLTHSLAKAMIVILTLILIFISIKTIYKKIKSKKIFCNCLMCDKCKK